MNNECRLCPRECGTDRLGGNKGYCGAGEKIKIAKAYLHRWEEPCLSGDWGSGTIFFSGCNLRCVFCQNYRISQEHHGREISIDQFVETCLSLQQQGAHNINLVSPTQYLIQIKEGLIATKERGLRIPVVYNSNGYEKTESLKLLEGLIDIYLPDLKYYEDQFALAYSGVADYFSFASRAIPEMYRQVGDPVFDDYGMMKKGLLVRHLILPGLKNDSKRLLKWAARHLPLTVWYSLMGQYTPVYLAANHPELARTLTAVEYDEVIDYFGEQGMENAFIQELDSAGTQFIPDFE